MRVYRLTPDGRCGKCDNRLIRDRKLSGHDAAKRARVRAEADAILDEGRAQGWEQPSDGGDEFLRRFQASVRDLAALPLPQVMPSATLSKVDGGRTILVYCKRCKINYDLVHDAPSGERP